MKEMQDRIPGIHPFRAYQDTLTAQHAFADFARYFLFLPTTNIQHNLPEIEIRELSSGTGSATASATDTERNTRFILFQIMEKSSVVRIKIDLAAFLYLVSKIYHHTMLRLSMGKRLR
jgi:hypothetical protein